jgi:shikimate dehydrogenase
MQDVSLERVVQFGAGGAGSAVAYALLTLGVKNLTLIEADANKADTLAKQFIPRFPHAIITVTRDPEAAVASADGIVNCTPIGMDKYPGTPFPIAWLKPSHWVSEIIYFPLETELLHEARALGCRTIDGSGMNVYQAAEAFRIITGLTPDPKRMRGFFDAL